jgi:imidazolonepropionase-like amidohydrolase
MNDDSSIKRLTRLGHRGISRRRVLEMTALGLAGTLLPTAPLVGRAFANDDRDRGRRRRVLLKGGFVLTLDEKIGDLPQGDVLIEGEKIGAIGRHLHDGGDAEVINCSGMIVMPA